MQNEKPRRGGWKWAKAQTHCQRGHEFTVENTGWTPRHELVDGYKRARTPARFCRACAGIKDAERRERPGDREQRAQSMRDWRANNPERNKRTWRANRNVKKTWLDSQKIVCCRCPETHVACLEFHHRDPKQKEMLLSVAVAHYSLDRIKSEVAKCDVICSNCHRKLHWDERQKKKLKTE